LITSLLMISSSQVLAHSNEAAGKDESRMTATRTARASGHEYVVAKNGADDAADACAYDDSGHC
jgi:hypothetical protein